MVQCISWTMVMVHIRTLTKKTTLESRLKYVSKFTVLILIIVGQQDSHNEEKKWYQNTREFQNRPLILIILVSQAYRKLWIVFRDKNYPRLLKMLLYMSMTYKWLKNILWFRPNHHSNHFMPMLVKKIIFPCSILITFGLFVHLNLLYSELVICIWSDQIKFCAMF